MQGLTSISGLASGLNTDEIIQKIIDAERKPIEQYQAQQDTLRARLSAYQAANTRLAAVKDAANTLANASFFATSAATSSDTGVATATAEIGAATGQYVVTVGALARAHQVVTQSYADVDTTTLGTGTLSITAGGETTTLSIDSSNNTLAGLRNAINRSNGSIRASIVQDGDASYRLMISSKETGTANALTLSTSLAGGTAPAFTDLQTAQDAKVTLGTGDDAITVYRSSNAVKDLIPGVTLNLAAAAPDTPLTVTVSQDHSAIQDAVQKLVDQYNNAVEYFNSQFKFDPDTNKGGTLLGDFTLRQVQNDVYDVFAGTVAGISGSDLAAVGITAGTDGKLTLNASTLQEKLDSDPESVTNLFALTSEATNSRVQLVSAGTKTVADGSAYTVEITQAARQARVTAGVAQAGALGADETLTLNGVAIQLTAGMTQTQVLAAINARSDDTHVRVSATGADGTGTGSYLTLRTTSYGSGVSLSAVSSRSSGGGDSAGIGNVAATQGSPAGEAGLGTGEAGRDVVGTINGEAATGTGQVLVGSAGNAKTDGLRLRITATEAGTLGTIRLFDGLAHAAQRTLDSITDDVTGPIHDETDSLNQRIDDLQQIIDDRGEALTSHEDTLRAKFNQLETALAQFQSQSAQLTSQLQALR